MSDDDFRVTVILTTRTHTVKNGSLSHYGRVPLFFLHYIRQLISVETGRVTEATLPQQS